LLFPDTHKLIINQDEQTFKVELSIELKSSKV